LREILISKDAFINPTTCGQHMIKVTLSDEMWLYLVS